MKIAIMQPYLFPYIGYFQLMGSVDKFVILDDVNFIKKGWINRNRILVDGKDHLFSIPLQKISQNKLICDTVLSDTTKWKGDLLKTLELCYKKAPFYQSTSVLVNEILNYNSDNISEFNLNGLRLIAAYVGIDTEIINSSKCYKNNILKGQDRIVDICKKEKASIYVNLPGGVKLYDKKIFSENDICLNFIKSEDIVYTQLDKEFVPNLSIIDVLMFNDRTVVGNYLRRYELI